MTDALVFPFPAAAPARRDPPAQTAPTPPVLQTRFDRPELNRLLSLYGFMVAAGEWRDYAIDFLPDAAVFSVFRRSSEMPLFRIEKRPALRARQGQYCVIAAGGRVLRRGHDLTQVLRVFDARKLRAAET